MTTPILSQSHADGAPVPAPTRAEGQWDLALRQLATDPDTRPTLTLALPFCAAHCVCCDRDVQATPPVAVIDDYLDGLAHEMQTLAARVAPLRTLQGVHLGGGSTTSLSERQVLRLFDAVRQHWQIEPDAEVSAQCDPRRVNPGALRLLRGVGVSHLVLELLDLDPDVQEAAGRTLSADLLADAVALARSSGFDQIQFDLMIGLPQQTTERWQQTLQQVVDLNPQRVRVRLYRHRPRQMPGQALIDVETLPDRTQRRALEALTRRVLQAEGYVPLGGERFVLPQDPALERAQAPRPPRLGCGAGANSQVGGRVYVNQPLWPAWRALVRAGRLPVVHTRQLAWYQPGDRLPDAASRSTSAAGPSCRAGLWHGAQP